MEVLVRTLWSSWLSCGFSFSTCIVLNSTVVSQKTNGKYGPMKTGFRSKLKELVDERIATNMSVPLAPRLVSLVLFGGKDDKYDGICLIEKHL